MINVTLQYVRCPFSSVQCGFNISYVPERGLGSNDAKENKTQCCSFSASSYGKT